MIEAERAELLQAPVAPTDWRPMLRLSASVIVFTFVRWAAGLPSRRIDSAVVAEGFVAIESNRKAISSSISRWNRPGNSCVTAMLVQQGDVRCV